MIRISQALTRRVRLKSNLHYWFHPLLQFGFIAMTLKNGFSSSGGAVLEACVSIIKQSCPEIHVIVVFIAVYIEQFYADHVQLLLSPP